jgi:hypothetical protein
MTPEEFAAKLTPASFAAPRQRFMTRVLLIAQANSQRRTPVRTGTLRRSCPPRAPRSSPSGVVGTNVEYAPFVHRRVPFFTQGLDDSRGAIGRELATFGGEIVKAWAT